MNNLYFSANSLDNFLEADSMAGMWRALRALWWWKERREEVKAAHEHTEESRETEAQNAPVPGDSS